MRKSRILGTTAFALATFALGGCAIVDKYSDRAVEYNLQAEKTQQQNLLLNIVRASLRRPMQFTGLTSITGTASASGSVSGGYTNAHQTPYPSIFNLIPPNSSTAISRVVTGTGGATAGMSGGPTFTVPVLDTQEFYQGILNPVSHQIIDYYVQQGFPPQLLFAIFVASVEIIETEGDGCDRFIFRNDARNELRFGQFQALSDYLLSSGFTTERVTDTIQYGPSIAASRARLNAGDTAKMLEAYSKASAAGLDIRAETDGGIRMQKRSSHYRFCFSLTGEQKPTWLGNLTPDAFCGNPQATRVSRPVSRSAKPRPQSSDNCPRVIGAQGSGDGGSSQFNGIKLSPLFLERIRHLQDESRASGNTSFEEFFPIEKFRRGTVTFKFQTRSVEGILYYLGEVTRKHLRPETGEARVTQIKTGLRYGTMPAADCDPSSNGSVTERKHDLIRLTNRRHDPRSYSCENLFVLETSPTPDAFYTVSYDGTNYSIPTDPARAGRSLQVLELIKQLLALHTSARQLPQSSVISIIGGTAQ